MLSRSLITGASSGIGRALVEELLERGDEVIAISRDLSKLPSHPNLHLYPCDVSCKESIQKVTSLLIEEGKIPNTFYLNAGLTGQAALESLEKLDLNHHDQMFSVNYSAVLSFVEQWLEPVTKAGGATFVVTSSVNAIFAPPGGVAYAASKAAISKAFDALRLTHIQKKLKFVTIFSGPVDTPGHVGKLPFTMSPQKMAKRMIWVAKKGKARDYPSKFYLVLAKLLNHLPPTLTIKFLGILAKK